MDTLNLFSRSAAPFIILEVAGELDIDSQDRFEHEVCEHLGTSSVIVDLSRLNFLAIASLRSLLVCQRTAAESPRALRYAAAPDQALRLVRVAGLDEVLSIGGTMANAQEPVTAA
jgi:anti-sigma B factor antagonist